MENVVTKNIRIYTIFQGKIHFLNKTCKKTGIIFAKISQVQVSFVIRIHIREWKSFVINPTKKTKHQKVCSKLNTDDTQNTCFRFTAFITNLIL